MLDIVLYPDSTLTTVCEPCDLKDPSLKELAEQMAEAMYATDGVGIAAPQVGVLKRLIVVDCDYDSAQRDPMIMINPTIEELRGEEEVAEEGCLSCPGISVPIARKPWARVRYYDFNGDLWEIEGDGLLGRCLQHEIDHLDGKTMFESCAPLDRVKARKDYELAKLAGAKPGEVG